MSIVREQTRKQRYDSKKKIAKQYPLHIATINFMFEDNLGFLIRSAACFGLKSVMVIGSIPDRKLINPTSGSLLDYVKIKQFSTPSKFLEHVRENNIELVSAEFTDDSTPLEKFKFSKIKESCIVVGHEEIGVPIEVLLNSKNVHIPMPGIGYCLNTSQTGNIMIYEAIKQLDSFSHQGVTKGLKNEK